MLKAPAQTLRADSCVIEINSYFCPNCPMDTALQGWIIIANTCDIVKRNYKIYKPGKGKLIHNSPEHWSGFLKTETNGDRTYYPSGNYSYVIRFYTSNKTVIQKKGTVYLTNYEDDISKIR
jgi:hypothetical protein